MHKLFSSVTIAVIALSFTGLLNASEPDKSLVEKKLLYSTPVREGLTNLYWGDLHLHSQLSADAYILQTRLTKDQAFEFARGQTVQADITASAREMYGFRAVYRRSGGFTPT